MGNASSGFAYDIGERVSSGARASSQPPHWQHHSGKRKADGSEVSIFKLDKVSTPKLKLEAAQHGFQKMKTMRHPYILQFLDGADLEKELVMVTEPVRPVREWVNSLSGESKDDQLAWGLRCLLSALDFLNATHSLTHGYVCPDTVFVTAAGDWKLAGLDLICEWRSGGRDLFHFQTHESIVPPEYRSPERRSGNIDQMLQGAAGALDIWAVGVMLEELLGGTVRGALGSLVRRMLTDAPASRPSAAQVLRQSYFSSKELLNHLVFLETFSLKEDSDKVRFFEGLASQISRLPAEIGVHKVLPVFRDYVRVEGTAQQMAANPSHRNIVLAALPCVLEISRGLEGSQFTALVEPLLLPLFENTDRAIRAQLLQQLQHLAPKFSDATLNGRIFDNVLVGFLDTSPHIRELTLKSIICLTDRLNEKNMNDKLLRSLSKLHQDAEPSIRTNTTIFLGRIAAQLKEGTRLRVLLPAFLKACRDPFPHARLAGLKAASACSQYFGEPVTIATKIIPTIAASLVDPDTPAREAAFQCHEAYMRLLVLNSQKLKEEEEKRKAEAMAQADKDGGAAALGSTTGEGGMISGLASWAATKLTASPTRPSALSASGSDLSMAGQPPPQHQQAGPPGPGLSAGGLKLGHGSKLRSSSSYDGWDEEDFFDTHEGELKPGAKGSSSAARPQVAPQVAEGWGEGEEDDWGLEEDGAGSSSSSSGAKPQPSASVAGSRLEVGGLRSSGSLLGLSGSGSQAAAGGLGIASSQRPAPSSLQGASRPVAANPLSADELLSMLSEPASTPATRGLVGSAAASSQEDSAQHRRRPSAGLEGKAASEKKGGKLQARKLQVKAGDWDDF